MGSVARATQTCTNPSTGLLNEIEQLLLPVPVLIGEFVFLMTMQAKPLPLFHQKDTGNRSLMDRMTSETLHGGGLVFTLPAAFSMQRMVRSNSIVLDVMMADGAEL